MNESKFNELINENKGMFLIEIESPSIQKVLLVEDFSTFENSEKITTTKFLKGLDSRNAFLKAISNFSKIVFMSLGDEFGKLVLSLTEKDLLINNISVKYIDFKKSSSTDIFGNEKRIEIEKDLFKTEILNKIPLELLKNNDILKMDRYIDDILIEEIKEEKHKQN